MHNKPKYNFFKNTNYALSGLKIAFTTETSFKIEAILGIFILLAIIFLDLSFSSKLILFSTGILILIVELINSAIENVVDMVTKEYNELAKNAKDIGSAAVFLSISIHCVCWFFIVINELF